MKFQTPYNARNTNTAKATRNNFSYLLINPAKLKATSSSSAVSSSARVNFTKAFNRNKIQIKSTAKIKNPTITTPVAAPSPPELRSEERRVGTECITRRTQES